jgi:hypothetical protein
MVAWRSHGRRHDDRMHMLKARREQKSGPDFEFDIAAVVLGGPLIASHCHMQRIARYRLPSWHDKDGALWYKA